MTDLTAAATASGGDVDDILRREEQRYRAQIDQNIADLNEILDDELIYTHNNGKVDSKHDFMRLVQAIHYLEITREGVKVLVQGSTAIVTGIAKITVERDGQIRHPVLRFVNIWVKREMVWKNYLWQATAVQL